MTRKTSTLKISMIHSSETVQSPILVIWCVWVVHVKMIHRLKSMYYVSFLTVYKLHLV